MHPFRPEVFRPAIGRAGQRDGFTWPRSAQARRPNPKAKPEGLRLILALSTSLRRLRGDRELSRTSSRSCQALLGRQRWAESAVDPFDLRAHPLHLRLSSDASLAETMLQLQSFCHHDLLRDNSSDTTQSSRTGSGASAAVRPDVCAVACASEQWLTAHHRPLRVDPEWGQRCTHVTPLSTQRALSNLVRGVVCTRHSSSSEVRGPARRGGGEWVDTSNPVRSARHHCSRTAGVSQCPKPCARHGRWASVSTADDRSPAKEPQPTLSAECHPSSPTKTACQSWLTIPLPTNRAASDPSRCALAHR